MTPEQKLWQLVKPHIPGHVNRVENSMGTGMPDVEFCYKGRQYWLENKVDLGVVIGPNRLGDCIRLNEENRGPKFVRESQYIWHSQRVKQGGNVFILSRDKDRLMLLRCVDLRVYIITYVDHKAWNWSKFTHCITEGWKDA